MGYGTCKQGGDMCHGCGYGYSWIGVWSSPTMANNTWTLVREARAEGWPDVVYFRVHVVFCKRTQLYVLWVNLNRGGGGDYAVGTSATPQGPFEYVHSVDAGRPSGGDFDIGVDDDGEGFLIYTETRGHTMAVERLTEDFLSSAANAPPAPPPAPPGYTLVGVGACRDASHREPPFMTNEPSHTHGFTMADCTAACSAAPQCAAVSFCSGNQECLGACHLYTTTALPPHGNFTTSRAGSGGKLPVTTVTAEPWWQCWATETAASVAPPANTSSGVFGNVFVEAPAMFKRKGVRPTPPSPALCSQQRAGVVRALRQLLLLLRWRQVPTPALRRLVAAAGPPAAAGSGCTRLPLPWAHGATTRISAATQTSRCPPAAAAA